MDKFVEDLCNGAATNGLDKQHAEKFMNLVDAIQDLDADQLAKLHEKSKSKCELAG